MNNSTKNFRLALIQLALSSDIKANLKKAIKMAEQAISENADLILFPELFKTLYFCKDHNTENFKLAEPLLGETYQTFSKIAKEGKTNILISIFEKKSNLLYHNSAILIDDDGKEKLLYRKNHIPDDPSFHEKFYFAEGDLGYSVVDIRGMKVGVLICWDQWFPEAFRILALKGAELILIPTAIGSIDKDKKLFLNDQKDAWITVHRGHAISNLLFVAAANRTGYEKGSSKTDGITFWGSSIVIEPFGKIIKKGSENKEELIMVDIDKGKIEETRAGWPFFRDRRVDLADQLTRKSID